MMRTPIVMTDPLPLLRHADEGRHPRLLFLNGPKSWMPTCVGMTGGGRPGTRNRAVRDAVKG